MCVFFIPPAVAGIIGAHALRFGITSSGLRTGVSQFASSLPFGAGYSFGTYLGFPKNYQSRNTYNRPSQVNLTMPYGYQPRRYSRYSRYSRFGRRRPYRRSYRSYRRYY